MDKPVRDHLRQLEERLAVLNAQIMKSPEPWRPPLGLKTEIRAVALALSYYRTALEIEKKLHK